MTHSIYFYTQDMKARKIIIPMVFIVIGFITFQKYNNTKTQQYKLLENIARTTKNLWGSSMDRGRDVFQQDIHAKKNQLFFEYKIRDNSNNMSQSDLDGIARSLANDWLCSKSELTKTFHKMNATVVVNYHLNDRIVSVKKSARDCPHPFYDKPVSF